MVTTFEVSKRVIGPAPDCPSRRRLQVSSTPQASGVTIPRPVTTTRRIWLSPRLIKGIQRVIHGRVPRRNRARGKRRAAAGAFTPPSQANPMQHIARLAAQAFCLASGAFRANRLGRPPAGIFPVLKESSFFQNENILRGHGIGS
ncbi:hypothetical protein MASR1M32_29490 [Rhodobacter sp.]